MPWKRISTRLRGGKDDCQYNCHRGIADQLYRDDYIKIPYRLCGSVVIDLLPVVSGTSANHSLPADGKRYQLVQSHGGPVFHNDGLHNGSGWYL